jgi:hypothetical protein
MRPATVHAVAQLVRHSRGLLTTVEKWIAATPPEALPEEAEQLVWIARGALTMVITTLEEPRPPAAPPRAVPVSPDRPAASAAARPSPESAGEGHVLRSDSRIFHTR